MERSVSGFGSPEWSSPRTLWVAVVVLNVIVCASVGLAIWWSRAQITDQTIVGVDNLSRVLEENLAGFVSKVDVALHAVEDEINRQTVTGGIDREKLNAYIRRRDGDLPEALGIRVTNRDGIITNAPDGTTSTATASIADTDHFNQLKDNASGGLVISSPILGHLSGKWLIAMARRHNNPDGSFGGIVQVSVPVGHFIRLFSGLNLGPGSTVNLYNSHPTIVARYPENTDHGSTIGTSAASPELRTFMASGKASQPAHMVSPVDGTLRTLIFRHIPMQPLFLVIGVADQDVFFEWRRTAFAMAGLAGLFVVLSIAFARMIGRAWSAQANILALNSEVISSSPVGILVYRHDGCCITCNPTASRLVGAPREMVLQQNFRSMETWRVSGLLDLALAALESGEEQRGELHLVTSFSREIWIVARFVRIPARPVPHLMLLVDDISERKAAESVMEARLRLADMSITHSLQELLVATLDELSVLIDADIGFFHFVLDDDRISMQAMSTRTIWQFCTAPAEPCKCFSPEEAGIWADCIRSRKPIIYNDPTALVGLKGAPQGNMEINRLITVPISRQGRVVAVIGFANKRKPFTDLDTQVVGSLADLVWDLTARKWAEETSEQRRKDLEASNADLEQFAYVASHDLQTPLRNIVCYSQLLERRYKGNIDKEADDFIGFIVDNGKKMTALITDLLEYSRVGDHAKVMVSTSAAAAVSQALDYLATSAEEAAATISVGTLPMVIGEPFLLVSLFQNLLSNALKYRSPDRAPAISVTAERISPDSWRFAVTDNGIGIDPDYFEVIFQIFQRLHPTAEMDGTGIGLPLCRRIVNRFGGKIWVESVPGHGATFFFTLRDGAI